jgi:hypothetical protein
MPSESRKLRVDVIDERTGEELPVRALVSASVQNRFI